MAQPPRIDQQRPVPGGEVPIPMELQPASTTPVYGSGEPTAGPADFLRRRAYSHPAHDPNRWLMLLAADRAETAGQLARDAVIPGRQGLLLRHFWRQAKSYPRGYAAVTALLLGAALVWKARKRQKARSNWRLRLLR